MITPEFKQNFGSVVYKKIKEKNMKKISRIMTMLMLCLAFLVIPTACKSEIKSHRVKTGTLPSSVVQNDVIDTSKVVVYYTYENGDIEEVSAKDLEFSTVDTSVVTENAKLTITYGDYSFDVKIKVVASAYELTEVSALSSGSQSIYNDNVTTNKIGFYNHTYDATKDTEEGSQDKYVGIEPRYVGTDNAFVMDLTVGGYDEYNKPIVNTEDKEVKVSTNITVELIGDNNSYTKLSETSTPTLSSMVTVDGSTGAKFQFTEEAEGKAFRVTVEPRNKKEGTQTACKVVAELHVIDGFNVHNAKELSVYDNSGRDYDMDGKADWNEIKEAAGIDVNYVPTKIILQNNIEITDEDVPSTMFWSDANIKFDFNDDNDTEDLLSRNFKTVNDSGKIGGTDEKGEPITLEGSMVDRDWTGVYHYNFTQEGGEINMIGNYFTVSCKDLSRAVTQTDGIKRDDNGSKIRNCVNTTKDNNTYMEMHATLFCHTYMFEHDDPASATERKYAMNEDCSISWENINFTGNGAVSDEAQYSGSIILFKSYRVNCDIYNCVSKNFAINYLTSMGEKDCDKDGEYRIDYCKGSDSYQALIFANGAEHLLVTNSSFERACGPAIIAVLNSSGNYDEYISGKTEKEFDFYISTVDIVNSKIESIVSGDEPWFKLYNASSQISQLTLAEALLNGKVLGVDQYNINTGKTLFDANSEGDQFNLQVLYMKSKFDFSSQSAVTAEGKVRFFDGDNAFADYTQYMASPDDRNNDLGINMSGTVANVAKLDGQIIVDGDNGYWFSAGFNGDTDKTASKLFLSAIMAMQNDKLENAQRFGKYMTMLSNTNYLDIYLPNFGMACRCQLYSK